MGQQQLLLVILVVIIVGVSTIVAVNIFGVGADNSNRDAVRNDLSRAASYVQSIWEKPTQLDGAARNFTNEEGLSSAEILALLNIPGPNQDYVAGTSTTLTNLNGTYSVEATGPSSLTITGTPSNGSDDIQVIVCRNSNTGNWLYDIDSPTATKPENCD